MDWVRDPRNIPIVEGDDVILFDFESQGIYQIHVLLESRGRHALDFIRQAFDRMFEDHGTEIIFGLVPDFRRDVKIMARWVGMKHTGKRATDCGPCEVYVLSRDMWKRRQSCHS